MARTPETYCNGGIFKAGIGQVVVCRYKTGGRAETGSFPVDASECDEEFIFGNEGKPFYVQGPCDGGAKAMRAISGRCLTGRTRSTNPREFSTT